MSAKKIKPKSIVHSKPKIKTKLSNSEIMFPELYNKTYKNKYNYLNEDFSKIYLTSQKLIKEEMPILEENKNYSKEKIRMRKGNLTYLNDNYLYQNNFLKQKEPFATNNPLASINSNNIRTFGDIFNRDNLGINNRLMYSLKSNQTSKFSINNKGNTRYINTINTNSACSNNSPYKVDTNYDYNDTFNNNDNSYDERSEDDEILYY